MVFVTSLQTKGFINMKSKKYVFPIRGHFARQEACSKLKIDDLIWLVPEPDNEHDKNAIRFIDSEGDLLGYVPSEENSALLRQLSNKLPNYCAKVVSFENDEFNQTQPFVEVYLAKEEEELPFPQERRFYLRTILGSKRSDETYEFVDARNRKNEGIKIDPNYLLIVLGLLFIGVLYLVFQFVKLIFFK